MRPARWLFTLSSLALPSLALVPSGCGKAPEARATPASDSAATKVEVATPSRTTLQRLSEEPGQIEAFEETLIHAKLSGFVQDLPVDIGDRVTKGQMLAELWVPEFEAEFKQKEAAVEQAKAELAQAKARLKVAEANVASAEARVLVTQAGIQRAKADRARWEAEYQRDRQLIRQQATTYSQLDEMRARFEGALSALEEVEAQIEFDKAALAESRAEQDKAEADVAVAETNVEVARYELQRADALLQYAKIEAPYDGVVIRRNVDTGHLVRPGANAEPLLVMARSDLVRIVVDVPERDAPWVDPGDRVLVRLQALEGRTFEGEVTRTSWVLDQTTRTLRTEIHLPNPDETLRPGLYAYATIILEEHENALTLPATAIVRDRDETYCVCVENGRAVRRPVQAGFSNNDQTLILSGLDGSEQVVRAHAAALVHGQAVEPVASEQP